jgi:hypothetical protein
VLGDSFMEAYSVNLDESFHRRLEQRLRAEAVDAETINLGVGGYGTLQEYLAYRDEGRRYAPDLVLLGFYVDNDVRNNSFELESRIETRGLKADSRPFLDPGTPGEWTIRQADYDGARRRHAKLRAFREGSWRSIRRRSALAALVLDQIEGWKVRRSTRGAAVPSDGDDAQAADREAALYGVHLCEEPIEINAAWELTERILRQWKQEVERDGARLVVFGVPSWIETDPATIRKLEAEDRPGGPLCLERPVAQRRLAGVLARLDIGWVALLPAFRRAAGKDGGVLFRSGDRHWNARGHALAAEIVAGALIERGLLPPADSHGGVTTDPTVP